MKPSVLISSLIVLATLVGCKKSEAPLVANDTAVLAEAAPPASGDWSEVVNPSAAGAYVMGNPNAAVKLIEIGAMACPFCKAFDDAGVPSLIENYVKPGKVSWEFRPYLIHGPVDLAADLIVRCNGAKSFFPLVRALYKDQALWVGKIQSAPPEKMAEIQNLPPATAFVEIATLAGLQDWAARRGVPHAKANQCLSDQKMIGAEVQTVNDVNSQYPDFSGTPAFVINGKLQAKTVGSWQALEPLLQKAAN